MRTPPRRSRGPLSALLIALLANCDPGFLMGAAAPSAAGPEAPAQAPAVRVVVCQGCPSELGAQAAAGQGDTIRSLLWLTAVRSLPARLFHPARTAALVAAIPPDHRAELAALAAVSGASLNMVLTANVLVDSQCSALVSPARAGEPLRVARNLDFFPASVIGPRSVVQLMRPLGKHAFASLGWPGFAGVTSGMNDAGLTACVLLNNDQPAMRPGVPVCFRIREILEHCASVDEAVACFNASPVASSHYVLLADRSTSALVWQGADGAHRDDPQGGWLAAANGKRIDGLPVDGRGRRLLAVGAGLAAGVVSDAAMRQALTASYKDGLNAQAMVFVPARLTLEFALGSAWRPAALGCWRSIELSALFAGGALQPAALQELGSVAGLEHPLTLR
jgi:hypothetical protein